MRLRRTALVLAAASSLLACTGLNKFQAGRRIEAEPRALGHEYKQEGKPIETFSMIDGVSQVEEARADATSARNWLIAGSVLAAAGAAGLGYGVVSGGTGTAPEGPTAGAGRAVPPIRFLLVRPADPAREQRADP